MFIKRREKRSQKDIGKIVHNLWIEKGMWEIYEKNLMTQIRMIKSKVRVTNTEIETINRKWKKNVGLKLMKVQCNKLIT